jgi:hypothetical protein
MRLTVSLTFYRERVKLKTEPLLSEISKFAKGLCYVNVPVNNEAVLLRESIHHQWKQFKGSE